MALSGVSPSLSNYLGNKLKTVCIILFDSIIAALISAFSCIPKISGP